MLTQEERDKVLEDVSKRIKESTDYPALIVYMLCVIQDLVQRYYVFSLESDLLKLKLQLDERERKLEDIARHAKCISKA